MAEFTGYNELQALRDALKFTQAQMGEAMGLEPHNAQGTWRRWEADPEKPAARRALERAKEIYLQRTGMPWVPGPTLRDLVRKEPEVFQAGAAPNLPLQGPQGATGPYLPTGPGYLRPVGTGWEQPQGPTAADRWAANRIAENALRDRGLFEKASQDQKDFLKKMIALGLATGDTPEELERGLKIVLDAYEAACQQGGK